MEENDHRLIQGNTQVWVWIKFKKILPVMPASLNLNPGLPTYKAAMLTLSVE